MMSRCTIFTGGEASHISKSDAENIKHTYVICADSGYLYANQAGVDPDLIIGDYDSLGYTPNGCCEVMTYPVEKDDTDLMLAIKQALGRGYDKIDIYGALGGRVDHTYSNIQSLSYICENGAVGRILSDKEELTVVSAGEYTFPKRADWSLSLFACSDKVEGLSISGTKYTAKDIGLDNVFPLGMSNVVTSEQANISFKSGRLLVIRSYMGGE